MYLEYEEYCKKYPENEKKRTLCESEEYFVKYFLYKQL